MALTAPFQLTIRQEQLHLLRNEALDRFADELVSHMREYFRIDYELLGRAGRKPAIRHGIVRAMHHGFSAKGEICRYVDLCLALGGHFDRDPLLPWASLALVSDPLLDSYEQSALLDEDALRYIEDALGSDGEHYRRALIRLRRTPYEALSENAGGSQPAPRELLTHLYPEKAALVTENSWIDFLSAGSDYSERFDLSPSGGVFFQILMFFLGTHVSEDPFWPWLAEVLGQTRESDTAHREEVVYNRSMAFLDEALTLIRRVH